VAIVIVVVDDVLITHQIRKKNSSLWPFLRSLIANWRNWTKLGHGGVAHDVWMGCAQLAATNRGR
jgi:hypothetical protein